jgi:thiamine-monophosphate kinase
MAEKAWIRRYFAPLASSEGAVNLTDDVAELDTRGKIIITQDALIEGVHFLQSDPIETVARKLVRVNVSDILAKGALPHEALLTLGWPQQGRNEQDMAHFAAALGEELRHWQIRLIGGDTTSVPGGLTLSLTLTGRCLGEAPVRRSGAQAGDDLWVTGDIGAALLGFQALRGRDPNSDFIHRFRVPEIASPATAELVASFARASMDVSDGLLADAKALAGASGVCAIIDLSRVPYAGAPDTQAARLSLVCWGDDYQVLMAAPAERRDRLATEAARRAVKISRIGLIEKGKGLRLVEKGISVNLPETLGFEHG